MTKKEQKKIADLAAKVTRLQDIHPDLVEVAWELWNFLPNH